MTERGTSPAPHLDRYGDFRLHAAPFRRAESASVGGCPHRLRHGALNNVGRHIAPLVVGRVYGHHSHLGFAHQAGSQPRALGLITRDSVGLDLSKVMDTSRKPHSGSAAQFGHRHSAAFFPNSGLHLQEVTHLNHLPLITVFGWHLFLAVSGRAG